jgi:hypothetical protein
MKPIVLIVSLTLFSFSIVQAQTLSNGAPTRQQAMQKGRILRKTGKLHANVYHANNGNRGGAVPKHQLTDNTSRAQPMVLKPLVPPQ